MIKFKYYDDPRELVMTAWGDTFAELLTQAATGMMTYRYPKQVHFDEHELQQDICIHASDPTELLKQWLIELIALSSTGDMCFTGYSFDTVDNCQLTGVAFGRRARNSHLITSLSTAAIKSVNDSDWHATISFNITPV